MNMSITDFIVKVLPSLSVVIPILYKLIKRIYKGRVNLKLPLRSISLALFVQIASMMILSFFMFIGYMKISEKSIDTVPDKVIIWIIGLSYVSLILLLIKLKYKMKYAYSIAANTLKVRAHAKYLREKLEEELIIISNRIENGNYKVEGKLKYLETLGDIKESKETIVFRWLSILSWFVIPFSSIVLIYSLNETALHVWYVSISILCLSIVVNSFVIHSDIKIYEGIIPLTADLGEKHVKQFKKKVYKHNKKNIKA